PVRGPPGWCARSSTQSFRSPFLGAACHDRCSSLEAGSTVEAPDTCLRPGEPASVVRVTDTARRPRPVMAGSASMETVAIPTHMLPADGRFGSGPSKVRQAQADMVAALGGTVLGTSHRQPAVRSLVGRVREGVAELFGLPEGYEVVLGNGGSTAVWDAAAFCLVRERAQHAAFGEFGGKFASATDRAPFLAPSDIRRAEPGGLAVCTEV